MRNFTSSVFWIAILLAAFSTFTTCKKDVDTMSSEVPAISQMTMNDSIWRVDSARMWTLWEKYWFYDDNGRNDSAIAICQKIIELGKPMMEYQFDSTIYERYAKSYGGIGFNLLQKGRLEEGLEFTQKSYDLMTAKFGEFHVRNTELCVGFSSYYRLLGDFEQAMAYNHKGLLICEKVFPKGHYYIGNMYSNIAFTYMLMEDYENAISYFEKMIDNYEKTAPPAMVQGYHILAGAHFANQDYFNAKKACLQSIRLATVDGAWRKKTFVRQPTGKEKDEWHYFDLPAVYILLGATYRETGDLENAFFNIQKGISLAQNHWEKSGDVLADGYFEMGKTWEEKGAYAEAINAYQKVFPIIEEYAGKGSKKATETYNQMGSLYAKISQLDSASSYHQKALHSLSSDFKIHQIHRNPSSEKIVPSTLLLETLQQKAKVLTARFKNSKQTNDISAALSTYSLSADMVDKMRHSYKWQDSKQSLSSRGFPILENGIETALEMHRLTGEARYSEQAFAFAERGKAFTLLENLNDLKAKAFVGISQELLEKEDSIHLSVALYERLILEEKNRMENADSTKIYYWQNMLLDLKKAQDSLTAVLEKKYPDYYRLKYDLKTATPKAVQKNLTPNATLLEYFLTDTLLYTFAIDKKQVRYFRQPIDSTFFQNLQTFRSLIHQFDPAKRSTDAEKQADFQRFVQSGRALYKTLLEPATSSLTPHPSSLIIVPDGALGYLPFQALLTQDVENEVVNYRNLPYAVKDFNIRYEYSATLLAEDWGKSTAPEGYLGFAPTYTGEAIAMRGEDKTRFDSAFFNLRGGIPALMFNKDEVRACAEIFNGTSLTEAAATEADFTQKAKNYRILHLAMHALTNDADPLYSQLVFTQNPADTNEDNSLHAYELYNMRLNADLAVLSACNTGAGKLVRGEGIMSLSRAFKYAGCPNILMSLWSVNDASAKDIVVDFHQKLKDGKGKAAALQLAQKNYLENTDEAFTHPFYWAMFVMVGNNDALPVNHLWMEWAVGLVLLLFVGIAFVHKNRNTRQP